MRTPTAIAICIASVVGAFALGRASKRPEVVTKTVEVTKEVEHEQQQTQVAATRSTQDTAERTDHIVTRRYRPNGTLAAETSRDVRADQQKSTQAQSVRVEYKDRFLDRIVTVEKEKITFAPQARFTLTALAGKTWDWRTEVGGALSVRIVGPFSLTVYATNHGAGGGLGVIF